MNSNNNNNNINNKIIDQESQGFENQTSQNKYSDFSKQSAAFSQTYERQHPYQIGICDDKIQNNFFQDMSSKQFNICQDAKQEMIEIVTIHKQQDKNQPEIQINANQDKSTQENQQQYKNNNNNDQGGNEGDSCDSCGSCRSCGSCGSFGD
ncbi:hypothetical protein TTHERM_00633090 (macronuclear) [Tetrahymena thermophila SB210]|uniref:Uncharacterized protein n=1 Tax=Tetrahymena thermophila (strain SB210) TaxID=312017 RepID=Q22X44_TETTS|nr:hypothetical protein TTHERM_00633090 [Tetrahymena thermophila SB210]EAR89802.2 hypothetical protein TTHERM_00633090 [Tetrahymena thermophila SB210]|eukprot:XP_001010047.2 hypothetical protein TTHERM_00633090 [Tetrahymena thermophila SB210]